MKLRLRSAADPRRTIRLDLPSPATLLALKSAVASALSDSADPLAVKLSLNRRDELVSGNSDASLDSLGLTSGDLVYFTLDPNEFSPPPAAAPLQIASEGLIYTSPASSSQPISDSMELRSNISGDDREDMNLSRESSILEPGCTVSLETLDSKSKLRLRNEDSERGIEDVPMEVEGCSSMEAVDGNEEVMADADDELVLVPPGKYVPLPSLLQKVLKDEGEEVKGNDVMLVVMVVHAVFLENGFVGLDSLAIKEVEGLGLPHGWAASVTTNSLKLRYTLPSLLSPGSDSVETINLRLQILGKFVTVYGSVPGKGSRSIRLSLDGSCYGPSIMFFMREKYAALDSGSSVTSHEKLVFELWKTIKDKLLFPLHIDICEKVGLPAPPCFMWLPTDLKFQILQLLPWMDLAKIACVCSEMKYLSSNDDLWKERYGEVFGEADKAGSMETRWKDKFAANVSRQKKLEADIERRRKAPRRSFYGWLQRPVPFGGGRFIGGDYDLNPGGLFNYGGSRLRPRRFSPHGNLNGSHSPF